jgi:3-dehydroquinate synthase
VEVLEIPAGEAHKTRESWARLTDALLAAGLGRDAAIVALGGGVVGDLAGFVAATYMRGIPYVQVPTTLLAMIDSSIGGKTGVDTPAGKNLVGAFHPPAAVIADVEALATLPHAQRRAGVAEAIKHGVIADARYFERIAARLPQLLDEPAGEDMRDLILRSIEIKSDVVCRDEREGGVRKILNFGHTLGHAIEAESEYRLLHGEAIAIGMVLEARLAERLGIAESGTAAEVQEAVARAGLPEHMPPSMTADRVVASTHADKKARAGAVEYALPVAIGRMAGESHGWSIPVSDDAVRELLAAGN